MRPQLRLTLAAVTTLALVATAARAEEKTGTITGKITYKGKPLTGGFITLVSPGAKIPGRINADGTYRVREMPVGQAKVVVESKGVVIPRKYADVKTTDLTITVKEGKQEYNIELK